MPLTVVTINLLADLTNWDERRPLVVKGLSAVHPDMVALQEVALQQDIAADLAGALNLPHVHLTAKTGEERQREGIAILSRLPFEETAELDLLSQERVAQRVRVQVDGHPLILSNAHLYWQPGDASARIGQVERLLSWLRSIPAGWPLVVCGDFNGGPNTRAVRLMQVDFRSAYAIVHGQEPRYTAPTPLKRPLRSILNTLRKYMQYIRLSELSLQIRTTMDYIFVNSRIRVRDCQLVLDQPAPGNPRLYASDHFGLVASLEVKD